jgi:NAD(P)-dependent dehydrogenase (short-subunit alcohol dehydrogenase family)/DNA-binding GntR family transcriptional regulator
MVRKNRQLMEPINRTRASRTTRVEVYDALRASIVSLQRTPGQRLSEAELARDLGVSRTPVREAIIQLRAEGLVEVTPQLGSFVSKISVRNVREAQFAREALECAAIREASQRIDPAAAARLRQNLALQRAAQISGDLEQFYSLDEAFHRELVATSGYAGISELLDRSRAHLNRVRKLSLPVPDVIEVLIDQHSAVLEAVERNDSDQAEAELRHHLRGVYRVLKPLRDAHPDYFVSSGEGADYDGEPYLAPPRPASAGASSQARAGSNERERTIAYRAGGRDGAEHATVPAAAGKRKTRTARRGDAGNVYLDGLFGLEGRVALVTGASGSIGEALARGLAASGATVALVARRAQPLEDLASSIRSGGGAALAVPADVLDRAALENARDEVAKQLGRLDILVNAAGGNIPEATLPDGGSFFESTDSAFERVVDLNLMGTVLPTKVFGAAIAAREPHEWSGSIVNISSMAAERAVTRVAGYSAAKAAVNGLTRWLAAAAAQTYGDRLRVNAIAPGFFFAEQNRSLLLTPQGQPTARARTVIEHTPAQRLGDPAELVSTLIWLCGPGASFVTGAVVPVDGGFGAFSGV